MEIDDGRPDRVKRARAPARVGSRESPPRNELAPGRNDSAKDIGVGLRIAAARCGLALGSGAAFDARFDKLERALAKALLLLMERADNGESK